MCQFVNGFTSTITVYIYFVLWVKTMMRYRFTVYTYYTKTIVLCSLFALLKSHVNTKTHINYFQL